MCCDIYNITQSHLSIVTLTVGNSNFEQKFPEIVDAAAYLSDWYQLHKYVENPQHYYDLFAISNMVHSKIMQIYKKSKKKHMTEVTLHQVTAQMASQVQLHGSILQFKVCKVF